MQNDVILSESNIPLSLLNSVGSRGSRRNHAVFTAFYKIESKINEWWLVDTGGILSQFLFDWRQTPPSRLVDPLDDW